MAKVCDIDASREDVVEVTIGEVGAITEALDHDQEQGTPDLAQADLCRPCRAEIRSSGLVLGLLTRYAAALPKSKRGTALTGLLPPGA